MLIEDVYTIKGKTFIRENDENGSSTVKETTAKAEYFVQDTLGTYKGFLDGKPLRKVEGSAYNVSGAYGEKGAKYVAIRDYAVKGTKHNKNPRTWMLDIETKVNEHPDSNGFPHPKDALEEISCIQILDSIENKIYLFSTFEFKYENDYEVPLAYDYIYCETEEILITKYLELFKELNPLVLWAWGGDNFDWPYMFNRFKKFKQEKKLGNYGGVKFTSKELDNGQTMNSLTANGHFYVDMLDVYKKFVYKNVPNYKLDTIAEIEINQRKVDHTNYPKFSDFYKGNYKITGKETQEQKDSKIYKLQYALDKNKVPENKIGQVKTYIKEKSQSEFLWYAIQDVIVLNGIHNKNQFTQLMMSMAETMGVNFKDVMGTIMPWTQYISNTVYSHKQALPPKESKELDNLIGGYVKKPIVGKHPWIFSLDYTSLYPNLIRAYNMSAEKFRTIDEFKDEEFAELYSKINHQDEDKALALPDEYWIKLEQKAKQYNVTVVFGGGIFDNDSEGFISELVGGIFDNRRKHKKKMLEYKELANQSEGEEKEKYNNLVQLEDVNQMTMKILINAFYGALGNAHFVLFNEVIARSITGMGRFTIKLTGQNVEEYIRKTLNPPSKEPVWLYTDTDSCYLSAKPVVDYFRKKKDINDDQAVELVDKWYQSKIDPVVQNTITQIANYTNAYQPQVQGADREVIAKGMFVSKKKYAMMVYDNEGVRYKVSDPYMKIQGLEIIKGGTAPFSKKYLKEAVPVILDSDEQGIRDWFNTVRSKFLEVPLDEISNTAGVSKVHNPDWGKVINGRKVSIPFGSRICVTTNNYLEAQNLTENYSKIEGGDKIKVLFLRQPNPLSSEAFAYNDVRFAEMFKKDIDYDTTFQKFFVSPLQGMLDAIGIDLNKNTEEIDVW